MPPRPRFPAPSAPALQPLDVLRPDADAIPLLRRAVPAQGHRPPASPRLLLCLDPEGGLCLPLDSPVPGIPRVAVPRLASHDWLDADAHAECDPVIVPPEAMARSEVVGYLDLVHIPAILDGLTRARAVPRPARLRVAALLRAFEADNADT